MDRDNRDINIIETLNLINFNGEYSSVIFESFLQKYTYSRLKQEGLIDFVCPDLPMTINVKITEKGKKYHRQFQ